MFSVFGEAQLDSINTNAPPQAVMEWKNSDKTKACYRKLFEPINDDENDTYIARILAKVWPGATPTNMKLAYTITVCQIMLSSHYEKLTMKEDIVKNRLRKNLVSNI
jgi:hypothetical protein